MKHLLFVFVMIAILMICPAYGLSLTFQDSGEFANYVDCDTVLGSCTWSHDTNGGNSYITTKDGVHAFITNKDPSPTTYAAATCLYSTFWPGVGTSMIRLYDSSHNTLYTTYIAGVGGAGVTSPERVEVVMVGGNAKIYQNGRFIAESPALAVNPSYVGFGEGGGQTAYWDDFVYGDTENRYIFGAPEQGYFIRKDMINPAASGFYYPNGTLVSSYNMTTTWGFSSPNTSQTIQLKEWSSGYVAGTNTTPSGAQAGSVSWALSDEIFNNPNAAYGYYVTTIGGSSSVSDVIPYMSYGASVAFDRSTYSRGDTASITYSVDGGGYWNTAIYSYRLDVLDVYGTVIDTQVVTTQTGSKSVTFTSSDPVGVYYAVLVAEPSTGSDIWMNFDYAELTGYLILTGTVYDARTEAAIPVATINIGQGTTWYNYTTSIDGNYTTTSAFYSGTSTSINVSASGYRRYTYTFTPLDAKTILLDYALIPTTPSTTGLAVGGVARDNVYGRLISQPNVVIENSTYSESYSTIGNSLGYYEVDETDGVLFTADRWYQVAGSKLGYTGNSYWLKVVGS